MAIYNVAMLKRLPVLLLLALASGAGSAWGVCSRDDVNYYLDKGFTREQVTGLCSDDTPDKRGDNDYRPYIDNQEENRLLSQNKRADDNEYLRSAVDAYRVRLTPRWLEYVTGVCLAVVNDPDISARGKICPDVHYRIYLKGLKVMTYQRKYLLGGEREIKVVGKVKRKLHGNLNKYPSALRSTILRSYKAYFRKDGTAIPVHDEVRVKRVIDILRTRAREAG